MTNNEIGFVDNILNMDNYIGNICEQVEEKYGVHSEYNNDTNTIQLNESDNLRLSAAKNYILSKIDTNLIDIVIKK